MTKDLGTLHSEDGNITLQVENTLFRVHRYFLVKHSSVFKDMFEVCGTSGLNNAQIVESLEGSSDENSIALHGDKSEAFACLLGLFYKTAIVKFDDQPVETWEAILLLADKYQMDRVRAIVLRHLGTTKDWDPVDKIAMQWRHQRIVDNGCLHCCHLAGSQFAQRKVRRLGLRLGSCSGGQEKNSRAAAAVMNSAWARCCLSEHALDALSSG
ncbi:hypothetical protein HGRIS_007075 [Hohenbuehelia grisea]|uniref:BTB domain-containing protein n=1 Tax=Hohenbuehelia grisea TaxID=104357 RepID=A0ABR3JAZ0_9AGAR